MESASPFKCVDELRGRQGVWAEPAAQIEKSSCNAQDNNSNAHQSSQRAASAQGGWLFFRGRSRVTRQLFAPMPLQVNLFLEPILTSGRLITYTLVPSTRNVPPASEGCGKRPESEYSRADQFRKEVLSDQMIGKCCTNVLGWQPSPDKVPQGSPEVPFWQVTVPATLATDSRWMTANSETIYLTA